MTNLRIGMDAKRIFCNRTGLGNYGRTLVENICQYDRNCVPVLYTPRITSLFNDKVSDYNLEVVTPQGVLKSFHSIWRTYFIINNLKKANLDIYHGLSHEIPYGVSKLNLKSVVTIHDLIYLRYPHLFSLIDRNIYHNKFKYACENVDYIIAISQQTADDVTNFFNIQSKKITVLYQSCDQSFYKKVSADKLQIIKDQYYLPSKFLLYVGTLEERKNALTIVKAIKELKDQGEYYSLVIIGKGGAYQKKIINYINHYQLNDQIIMLGRVKFEHLPAIYQQATLFIYPSIFEGFGIPIVEAIVSRTPVITSRGSCFSEVAGPYSCYINPLDKYEMAGNIKRIMGDGLKQKEMIDKGLQFVKKFHPKEVTAKVVEFYYQITS